MTLTLVDVCSGCPSHLRHFYEHHVLMKMGPTLE